LQGHGQADLVRSLFGINGEVAMRLNGEEVSIATPRDAVRKSFAFISGDREREGAFSERSLAENLSAVTDLVKREETVNPDGILDRYGVHYDNPRQIITSLSGGNQQKVVVGRWLSSRPTLLLADDPTKGIDVSARSDLHNMFCDMAARGSAVVMVSSDDEELVSLAAKAKNARVVVMYEGGIVATLRGDTITAENIAAASMPSGKHRYTI
jgi:ABC-type sugar transport system ATPase subunit